MERFASQNVRKEIIATCLAVVERWALLSTVLTFAIFWVVLVSSAVSLRIADVYRDRTAQSSVDVQAGAYSAELRSAIEKLTNMGVTAAILTVGVAVLILVRAKGRRDYRHFALVLATIGFCIYWFAFAQLAIRSFIVNL